MLLALSTVSKQLSSTQNSTLSIQNSFKNAIDQDDVQQAA